MSDNNSSNQFSNIEKVRAGLPKRYRSEKAFQYTGIAFITFALLCVVILFSDIIYKGHSAFLNYSIQIPIDLFQKRSDFKIFLAP